MTSNIRRPSDATKQTRHLSKVLFGGAQYRLEVGAAVAGTSDGIVSVPSLAKELGLVAQSVNQEVLLLERAGLLVRTDAMGGRTVYFQREASTYWSFCQEASTQAATMLRRGSPL
jgi:biotin operon repressor